MRSIQAPALPDGYAVEVDRVDAAAWHALLDRFADASIYQTWPYATQTSAPDAISHLVLRRGIDVVAVAQARIVRLPLLNWGVAYFRWGPLWQLRGQEPDPSTLTLMLTCIHDEYAVRRGLTVRILPYLHSDRRDTLLPALQSSGYAERIHDRPQRTLLMPLDGTLQELRSRLDQKWRNCLNRAEKNDLVVEQGDGDDLFERFVRMHQEMRERKGFEAMSDPNEFRAIQRDLPARHKMQVILASRWGTLAAGIVCSRIGDFGLFLHGATSDAGLGSNASYLLQWRALGWLRSQGAITYNLHGINPTTNPGTYRFKAGLGGRAARDVHYLGTFESSSGARAQTLMGLADTVRRAYRRGRTAIRHIQTAGGRAQPAPGTTR
jgi:lipid II:glycine glycyltransferase (peptidoglycan interpeptide bridge formation enzyme)